MNEASTPYLRSLIGPYPDPRSLVGAYPGWSAPARDPHDAAVEELVDLYRAVQGDHPDWDDYRAAMVRDRRLVLRLRAERAYGMVHRG